MDNTRDWGEKLEEVLRYVQETDSANSLDMIRCAEHVCIFGMGRMFEEAYEEYFAKHQVKVDYVSDNNPDKWGKYFHGLKCISPQELEQLSNVVVIPLIGDSIPVEKQLQQCGITTINMLRYSWDLICPLPAESHWFDACIPKIRRVYSMLADQESRRIYVNVLCNRLAPVLSEMDYADLYHESEKQYFPKMEGFQIGEHEVFCDAGAYVGDTILDILEITEGRFDGIYSFEMDAENYRICQESIAKLPQEAREKIHCCNYGVWDEDTQIRSGREENGSSGSNSIMKARNMGLRDTEVQTTRTVRLDTYFREQKVSFLKMDIEGAELHALRGAERLIREQQPKLAICIYHGLTDMWEVPLYIASLVPEYRLSVRQHSATNFWETVCYAYK